MAGDTVPMANNKYSPAPIPRRLQIHLHPFPTPPRTAYPHPLALLKNPYTLAHEDALHHALCHRLLRFVNLPLGDPAGPGAVRAASVNGMVCLYDQRVSRCPGVKSNAILIFHFQMSIIFLQ